MFNTKLDQGNKNTVQWLNSLPQRMLAYQKTLLYYVSLYLKDQVKGYVPDLSTNKDYYESIQHAIISTQNKKDIAYAVILSPRASRVKKLNAKKSIVFIKPKKKLGKVDPKVSILERYSPWTLDTIPFMPDKRNAVYVYTL